MPTKNTRAITTRKTDAIRRQSSELTSGAGSSEKVSFPGCIAENDVRPRANTSGSITVKNTDAVPERPYPGGKNGAGVFQAIINMIPPHTTYIETHLGGGAIMKNKRPAKYNYGIDIDPEVISLWENKKAPLVKNGDDGSRYPIFKNVDASSWLKNNIPYLDTFVYVDPPYLMETRKGGKLYNFEMTDNDHLGLLKVLKKLGCMVMISGYWSKMYEKELKGWNTKTFQAMTRQGLATEWIWYNYPDPKELHDYSYLGSDFRERERIQRKRARWMKRISSLPVLERKAFFIELNEKFRSDIG